MLFETPTDSEFAVYFRHHGLLNVFVVDATDYWAAIKKVRQYATEKRTRPDGAILVRIK